MSHITYQIEKFMINQDQISKVAEYRVFKRLITETYPSGIVSIVSDTFDFWSVVRPGGILSNLKEEVLARQENELGLAKVVIRPDSGDPVEIICGAEVEHVDDGYDLNAWVVDSLIDGYDHDDVLNPGDEFITGLFEQGGKYYRGTVEPFWNRHDKTYYYMDGIESVKVEEVTLTPEELGAVGCLYEVFGGATNEKGFKTLNQRVGLIYGDSITLDRAEEIMRRLAAKGFASDNVVLGVGSYTYQFVTRDTFGFAMKATHGVVNGEERQIQKSPKTDPGKKSACGRMVVVRGKDGYEVIQGLSQAEWEQQLPLGEMKQVFRNGVLLNKQSFEDVKMRLAQEL